jgi:hypothetical protein
MLQADWRVAGDIGVIDAQTGVFSATRIGQGKVVVQAGERQGSADVEIHPGAPDAQQSRLVSARLDLPADGKTNADIIVHVQDRKIYYPGVIKFLSSFDFLNAESFANELGDKDSIISQTPFLVMSVTDKKGKTKKMTVFQMPLNKRSKLQHDQYGNELPFDLDRFYALINDGKDFVVIQNFVFGKVFRKYEDFLKRAS